MLITSSLLALLKCLVIPFILLLSITSKGGASQACAACKYQRRRCTPDCPLAPFFPADQPKIFQNAHRLYGVANMMRILKHIRDDQKDDAMKSIKYESNMWERSPSRGCYDVLLQLHEQIQAHVAELAYVRGLIEMVRRKENHRSVANNNNTVANSPWLQQFSQLSINPSGLNSSNYGEGTSYDAAEMKPLWAQQQLHNSNPFFRVSQAEFPSQQEIDPSPYDSFVSEALVADDKQSYTEGKEACDLSTRCSDGSSTSTTVKASSQNQLKTSSPWFTPLSLSDDQDH